MKNETVKDSFNYFYVMKSIFFRSESNECNFFNIFVLLPASFLFAFQQIENVKLSSLSSTDVINHLPVT